MGAPERIDRQALVRRHHPALKAFDTASPLSVGNGEFAFTADATGLQTFPEAYDETIPLGTLSQWGWHTAPNPQGFSIERFRFTEFEAHGRAVGYADIPGDRRTPEIEWLRANHRRYQVRIVNLSLGHPVFESYEDDPLAQAVQRLIDEGLVVVASAGNYGKVNVDGKDIPVFGGISSPGNLPDVITVGALNTFGTVATVQEWIEDGARRASRTVPLVPVAAGMAAGLYFMPKLARKELYSKHLALFALLTLVLFVLGAGALDIQIDARGGTAGIQQAPEHGNDIPWQPRRLPRQNLDWQR